MKKKVLMIMISAFTAATIILTGCGSQESVNEGEQGSEQTDTAENSASGKTQLNVVAELITMTVEPAHDWDGWYLVRWGVGETLVKYGDDGTFEPWLAESWEVADDNLTWTFKLRDDVVFSNGEKMTATKVVESIERLYELTDIDNGGTGNPQGYMTYSSLSADDDSNTVTIVTETPTPDMPGVMAHPWMMIVDAEASEGLDTTSECPICTGPYVITEFVPDTSLKMAKNENYWDGEVPFETVDYMKVGESSTRTMALQDGSADIALNISASDREILEQEGTYNISVVSGYRDQVSMINFDGVLGNDDLRAAIMMALDEQTIAEVTTNGAYEYGYALIAPQFGYSDGLTDPYPYDVDAANKRLDDAGIVDTDGDGYRELDGKNIELNMICSQSRQMDIITQAEASLIEEIGIKTNIQLVEAIDEYLKSSSFDIVSTNYVTSPTGDPGKFFSHWYSESSDNFSHYSNPEYDEIYNMLTVEFDEDKRREYICELQQIILDDAAAIVGGYFNNNLVSTEAVTGAYNPPCDFYWITKDIKPAE